MPPSATEYPLSKETINYHSSTFISPGSQTHPRKIQPIDSRLIRYYIRPLNLEGGQWYVDDTQIRVKQVVYTALKGC